jgi:hypothetical protein
MPSISASSQPIEIAPCLPLVVNQLPRLTQGTRSTVGGQNDNWVATAGPVP